jgi:hypothetical protein
MSKDITEMIDDICESQYGHTNWGFADMLTEEELKEIKDKELGDKMPSIIFYHDDVKSCDKLIEENNMEIEKLDKEFNKIFKDPERELCMIKLEVGNLTAKQKIDLAIYCFKEASKDLKK